MKALGRYAIASIVVVLVLVGAVWLFVDVAGHASLLLAAAIVLPVQLLAFALVFRSVGDSSQFLLRWGIGVMVRTAVVAGIGLTLDSFEGFEPTVLLMAVCGFFFALLILESVFFLNKRSERFAQ